MTINANPDAADTREKAAASAVQYTFPASFDGPVACGHRVETGDILARLADDSIVCEGCARGVCAMSGRAAVRRHAVVLSIANDLAPRATTVTPAERAVIDAAKAEDLRLAARAIRASYGIKARRFHLLADSLDAFAAAVEALQKEDR